MILHAISIQLLAYQCMKWRHTFGQFSVDVVFENVGSNFSRDDLLHSSSQRWPMSIYMNKIAVNSRR